MLRNPITHKNIKFSYYLNGVFNEAKRKLGWQPSLEKALLKLKDVDLEALKYRLDYYCNIFKPFGLTESAKVLSQFSMPKKNKTYYFDLIENTAFFPNYLKIKYKFGDIQEIQMIPTLVKSRPLQANNANSILMKFNRIRHYTYTKDRLAHFKKEPMLIGRANVKQEHRRNFLKMYFDHPMCDVGQINSGTNHDHWLKPKISINEHLKYKFILCQEGFDVASNLKWVMSSNSLAVMPKPKFETWYMEGELIGNEHYVEIEDDFSNLEERLNYYLDNIDEALQITRNANAYFRKFCNKKMEKLLGLLVLERFFVQSGQCQPIHPDLHKL